MLFFASTRVARRRLAMLAREGLLESRPRPHVTTGRPELLFRLSAQGAAAVGEDVKVVRFSGWYGTTEHRLRSNAALIHFRLAAATAGFDCLDLTELEARQRCAEAELKPVPDGVVCLVDHGNERRVALLLEIDLASENLRRTGPGSSLAGKIADYEALLSSRRFPVPVGEDAAEYPFRVLFITTDGNRLGAFQRLLRTDSGQPGVFWGTTFNELELGILGPIWRRGVDDSLVPLVSERSVQTSVVSTTGELHSSV
jgi:hypothetical protein